MPSTRILGPTDPKIVLRRRDIAGDGGHQNIVEVSESRHARGRQTNRLLSVDACRYAAGGEHSDVFEGRLRVPDQPAAGNQRKAAFAAKRFGEAGQAAIQYEAAAQNFAGFDDLRPGSIRMAQAGGAD